MLVSCVHPAAVLNASFCMTFSLFMPVEDARGILQSRSRDCLVVAISISFCLPHPVAVSALLFIEGCVRVLRCCQCVCCM